MFISERKYPLAYNKWIKYQLTKILNKPDIYQDTVKVLFTGSTHYNDLVRSSCLLKTLFENNISI